MTKLQMSLTALAVSCFALPLTLSQANAGLSTTAKLMNCKYDSRQKTIECCNSAIKLQKNRPYWLPTGSGACNKVVKCYGGKQNNNLAFTYVPAQKPKCFVVIPPRDDTGGDTPAQQIPSRTFDPTRG